ncbi:MAG: hypothetical protein AAGG75_18805 [Bacteroidota bacterium]
MLILSLLLYGCKTPPRAYSFFVAGHVYGSTARKAPGLHPPFVADFATLRQYPDMRFGVFAGDIVYYSRNEFWDAVDQQIDSLGLKVHFAVGNHDEGHKSPYKDRYGLTYYAFEQEGDLCIVLNPGLGGWNIWKDQMAFLKKQLARSKSYHNIFIFFHQVLWWTKGDTYRHLKINSLDGRTPTINFWPEVVPLLEACGRPVYLFAGDIGASRQKSHLYAEQYKNLYFLATGMGDQVRDNYLLVEVDKAKKVVVKVRMLRQNTLEVLDIERDRASYH